MRRLITNIMATTGLSVVLLSVIVRILFPEYDLFFSFAVLQIFGANVVIHLGFLVTRKFESKYMILEVILDITYTTIVLIVFGVVFDWFGVTPVYMLIAMAAVINLAAMFLSMARVKEEANTINKLLKKRNAK